MSGTLYILYAIACENHMTEECILCYGLSEYPTHCDSQQGSDTR